MSKNISRWKIYGSYGNKPEAGINEDPTIIYWKVYYGNGTEWSPGDGIWADAPDDDLQVVVLWRADGMRRILRGTDYYWHDPKAKVYTFGATDEFTECIGFVKTGRWLPDEEWYIVLWRAITDYQFLHPPISP